MLVVVPAVRKGWEGDPREGEERSNVDGPPLLGTYRRLYSLKSPWTRWQSWYMRRMMRTHSRKRGSASSSPNSASLSRGAALPSMEMEEIGKGEKDECLHRSRPSRHSPSYGLRTIECKARTVDANKLHQQHVIAEKKRRRAGYLSNLQSSWSEIKS